MVLCEKVALKRRTGINHTINQIVQGNPYKHIMNHINLTLDC